jgi:hypothetical protein
LGKLVDTELLFDGRNLVDSLFEAFVADDFFLVFLHAITEVGDLPGAEFVAFLFVAELVRL